MPLSVKSSEYCDRPQAHIQAIRRVRDDADFERHVDYIHFNPVKHGWAERPADWSHSSIHRFIREGVLDAGRATVSGAEMDAAEWFASKRPTNLAPTSKSDGSTQT